MNVSSSSDAFSSGQSTSSGSVSSSSQTEGEFKRKRTIASGEYDDAVSRYNKLRRKGSCHSLDTKIQNLQRLVTLSQGMGITEETQKYSKELKEALKQKKINNLTNEQKHEAEARKELKRKRETESSKYYDAERHHEKFKRRKMSESFDVDAEIKNLHSLIIDSMNMGKYEEIEKYYKEFEETLNKKSPESLTDDEKSYKSALDGVKAYCTAEILKNKNNLIGAVRNYKEALRCLVRPEYYRTNFAIIHQQLGDIVYELTFRQNIGLDKQKIYLRTAIRHFKIAAEGFSLDTHLEKWKLCIRGIVFCYIKLYDIGERSNFKEDEIIPFLKTQAQRTDVVKDCTDIKASSSFVFIAGLLKSNFERVLTDPKKVITDSKSKIQEIDALKLKIEQFDVEDLNRKSLECKLATLYMQIGENLNAIFTLIKTIKGATWSTNANLLSFAFALIGVSWLNLGDPEGALPYLRDAEYSYDTDHSRVDHRKIQEKRIIAEIRLRELRIEPPVPQQV